MSCTRGSPNCPSRSRDTASYSYSPCCALVVDLICHSINSTPNACATSCASTVLPVPGSPFTNNGRCNVTDAFTATSRSREAIYRSVLLKDALTLDPLGNAVLDTQAITARLQAVQAAIPSTGANGGRPRIMSAAFSAIIIVVA